MSDATIEAAMALSEQFPIRVLVADIDLSVFHLVRLVLALLSVHRVEHVGDGAAVVAAAERFIPDMILLSDAPPAIDGLRIAARLRRRASTASIPIVVFTQTRTLSQRLVNLIAMSDYHLTRPCSARDLSVAIRRCVPRYGANAGEPTLAPSPRVNSPAVDPITLEQPRAILGAQPRL
jgi:DNA-binding response OmpR family regulator